MESSDWISVIAIVVSLLSFGFAWWKFAKNAQSEKERELLNCAIDALEKAYFALTGGSSEKPPKPDRLNWLTAARRIEFYKEIKKNIKSETFKTICEAEEEHWRHKFSLILDSFSNEDRSYYEEKKHEKGSIGLSFKHAAIDSTSAIVVHHFESWPKDKECILKSVDVDNLLKETNYFSGRIGLTEYLKTVPRLKKVVDKFF
ncbi:hypothetical protein [Salidesulfovibrio onnuriiensis]|uniref:hypothetical protein n=1 Tax=Salidesulfovibrio onnuriiensis TaxID=2583823 RepID=UPI0011C71F7D|nr:hypothetical protein [Salidesulfovibrio onnuriiensis]